MLVYFVKATYTNGIYKISDFYTGNSYKTPTDKSLDIQLEASDGIVITKPTTGILPDNTTIRDYTHMLVPGQKKIYKIIGYEYVNISQTRMTLQEDPLLSNYRELETKNIMLSRTNDESKFIGLNNMLDIAIKHEATVTANSLEANSTGSWVLFTFQKDVIDLEFEIGEIDNYPSVGTFESKAALDLAYPRVDTTVPYEVDFYLKFAEVTSTDELYQAIYSDEDGPGVSWIRVMKSPLLNVSSGVPIDTTRYTNGIKIANLGDIDTVQVAFPIDATLIQQKTITRSSASTTEYFTVPAFNSIKSWNNSDKLISIKLIPQELLGINYIERNDIKRIINIVSDGYTFSTTKTVETYLSKVIEDSYLVDNGITDLLTMNLPMYTVKQFVDTFEYNNWSYLINNPTDYEPFKKYYLYLFGEMIDIPARYILEGFKVRLAVTSTDILYEVYTDKMNIIGSGRLMWFTRYAVDQLALFEANNPTYKEQFWVNQFRTILQGGIGGGIGGYMAGYNDTRREYADEWTSVGAPTPQPFKDVSFNNRPKGALIGGGIGAGLAAANTVAETINLNYMQKGLRDKADQIFGQNDVALTNLKGFGSYLVTISPEVLALNQMITAYNISGFSTNTLAKINALPYETNPIFGSATIVAGQLLEVVKNQNATDAINRILQEGIILIP